MENNEKEVLFSVSHLKKYFQVGNHATLKAVDDVSFEIYKGETLGMVGVERQHAAVPASACMTRPTDRCSTREPMSMR